MKFKAILGAAVVLGTMMLATVTAQAATTYKVGAKSGSKGGQVTLPITVSSDTGTDTLNGYIVKLEYDATQVTPVQNQEGDDEALKSLYGSTPLQEGVFVSDRIESTKGTTSENLAVAWAAAGNHVIPTAGETIAEVTFEVNENATASSIPVSITLVQMATDDKTLSTTAETVAGKIDLASIKYGDINGNDKVDIDDVGLASKAYSGLITLTADQTVAADVNGNSKVDIDDVGEISKFYAGLITKFSVEK